MDFTNASAHRGWLRLHALRWRGERRHWHTFGEHQPDYTPLYTYAKFRLEGIRSRYRRREQRALDMLRRLCVSPHPGAPLALIAMAHGFFCRDTSDQLAPYQRTPDFDWLQDFLAAAEGPQAPRPPDDGIDAAQRFRDAYAFGVTCRQRRTPASFLAHLQTLRSLPLPHAAAPIAGLCHGLFQDEYREDLVAEGWQALLEIL